MSLSGARAGRFGMLASAFAAALALAGPLLAHFEIVPPIFGLIILLLGSVVALAAMVLIAVGAVKQRRFDWRVASALGVDVVVVGIIVVASLQGGDVPRINDITTDTKDPPGFSAALELEANEDRDLSYDPSFAEQQRAAYGDVQTLQVDSPPAEAFGRALAVARELGWDIHAVDRERLAFEATERSWLFRFVDDIVVRVQPTAAGGSAIDVRSKSRDGKGDWGVNAERIRAFIELLAKR